MLVYFSNKPFEELVQCISWIFQKGNAIQCHNFTAIFQQINKPEDKGGAVLQNKVELDLSLFLSSFVVRLGGRKEKATQMKDVLRKSRWVSHICSS